MEYATVYRHKDLLSIDNVTMCTVPMNSEREGGAILKGQEVAGMQDVPMDMQCPDPARKLSCRCRILPWTSLLMCKKCKRCPGSPSASDNNITNMVKLADHVQCHGDGDAQEYQEKARHGLGDGDCG